MLFVGLTGGIGAGKSEALAACERLGAAVLSSDAVVHELLGSEEVRDLVASRWGEEAVPGDHVDRAKVAAIVFERPEELRWLEGVLFPRVGARTAAWRADVEREGQHDLAVVEVPLLFEAGIEKLFDATVAVIAEEETRARRAGARGHEGVGGREARQLTQDEKAVRADFVVRNDGSLEELEKALANVFDELAARERTP